MGDVDHCDVQLTRLTCRDQARWRGMSSELVRSLAALRSLYRLGQRLPADARLPPTARERLAGRLASRPSDTERYFLGYRLNRWAEPRGEWQSGIAR